MSSELLAVLKVLHSDSAERHENFLYVRMSFKEPARRQQMPNVNVRKKILLLASKDCEKLLHVRLCNHIVSGIMSDSRCN